MAVVDELVEEFLRESFEHLECFQADLATFRDAGPGADDLQRMFRAVHTVKGVCGFLGFTRLEAVTVTGENLVGKVRDGGRMLDADVFDALDRLAEVMREILQHIGSTGEEAAGDDSILIARMADLALTAS
jgi:two-component system chemotaxis sensor kinase CheA